MSVVSFAVDDVVTGLVAALQAADGFRHPAVTGDDVPVYDGAIYGEGRNTRAVVIGSDGSEDQVQRPARFTSDWHDYDLTTDEAGTIQCAVVVWSGDSEPDTVATQRGQAVGILQDVDTAVRTSITAATLGVTQLLWSKIDAGEIVQITVDGTETRLSFQFSYRALLQVT